MRIVLAALLAALPDVAQPFAPPTRELALADCSALIVAADGEKLWPGWAEAPQSFLLVAGDREWVVAPPKGLEGFDEQGSRKRQFDPKLLATFPVFGSEPTVVVGTPEATGKAEGDWLRTLVHERFHQFQYSRPGYYERVAKLGLAHGDTTGMWMLTYPFPYDDRKVGAAFATFSKALGKALRTRARSDRRNVEVAWRAFRDTLQKDDYAYFRFQAWQEGVARYTEIAVKTELPCARGISEASAKSVLAALDHPALAEEKRVAFYAIGAGIAMFLDDTSPHWKRAYLERPFEIDRY